MQCEESLEPRRLAAHSRCQSAPLASFARFRLARPFITGYSEFLSGIALALPASFPRTKWSCIACGLIRSSTEPTLSTMTSDL